MTSNGIYAGLQISRRNIELFSCKLHGLWLAFAEFRLNIETIWVELFAASSSTDVFALLKQLPYSFFAHVCSGADFFD